MQSVSHKNIGSAACVFKPTNSNNNININNNNFVSNVNNNFLSTKNQFAATSTTGKMFPLYPSDNIKPIWVI